SRLMKIIDPVTQCIQKLSIIFYILTDRRFQILKPYREFLRLDVKGIVGPERRPHHYIESIIFCNLLMVSEIIHRIISGTQPFYIEALNDFSGTETTFSEHFITFVPYRFGIISIYDLFDAETPSEFKVSPMKNR